ncbi:MAG: hypothetical protein LBT05_09040 [Planctomycetaceae bacterium]|nr:hypothetical protein [Planctomycetaceae bacterium]
MIPNVLTLDYVDVKVGDEERKDIYTWAANRFVFQKHGMGGNTWDSQVQFKDNLITKKFLDNSGFEATYHFTLQESIPNNLAIVIERPDLYKIYCNDKEVNAIPNAWRFDKSFGKIDLSKVAKVGENNVKIVAQPMTIEHELEPAYLLGDFSLQNADKGFIVVPPQALSMNPPEGWNRQGTPFYAGKVEYSQTFPIEKIDSAQKYFVQLPPSPNGWYGSTAQVAVNGQSSGFVIFAPYQIDVTKFIKEGKNEIAVIILGTPKNLLGPHHAGKIRGSAWSDAFRRAPERQPSGASYDTIGYGLFEPFRLLLFTE